MSIDEGNKLIAEFAGMSLKQELIHGAMEYEWIPAFNHSNWCFPNPPPFHISWDRLMPVVEKINNLVENEIGGSFINIYWHGVEWGENKYDNADYSKLGATWQAVVQFIQWYNEQNKAENVQQEDIK